MSVYVHTLYSGIRWGSLFRSWHRWPWPWAGGGKRPQKWPQLAQTCLETKNRRWRELPLAKTEVGRPAPAQCTPQNRGNQIACKVRLRLDKSGAGRPRVCGVSRTRSVLQPVNFCQETPISPSSQNILGRQNFFVLLNIGICLSWIISYLPCNTTLCPNKCPEILEFKPNSTTKSWRL